MATIGGRAGRYVPGSDWRIMLADHTLRAMQRIWCWREFSLPLLAMVAAYKTGHPALASMALTLVIGVVVLLLLARPRTLTRTFRRCRTRSRRLSRQLTWPRVCRDLGWARRLEHDALLIPDLISWTETDRQVTVLVRPLPEQAARSWDQMADALRRFVGGATVQWREAHGTLTVVVSLVVLPGKLGWGSGLSDGARITIGQRHGGALLALDVLRTPHVLLAGGRVKPSQRFWSFAPKQELPAASRQHGRSRGPMRIQRGPAVGAARCVRRYRPGLVVRGVCRPASTLGALAQRRFRWRRVHDARAGRAGSERQRSARGAVGGLACQRPEARVSAQRPP
jgi:hypothetical protein